MAHRPDECNLFSPPKSPTTGHGCSSRLPPPLLARHSGGSPSPPPTAGTAPGVAFRPRPAGAQPAQPPELPPRRGGAGRRRILIPPPPAGPWGLPMVLRTPPGSDELPVHFFPRSAPLGGPRSHCVNASCTDRPGGASSHGECGNAMDANGPSPAVHFVSMPA